MNRHPMLPKVFVAEALALALGSIALVNDYLPGAWLALLAGSIIQLVGVMLWLE